MVALEMALAAMSPKWAIVIGRFQLFNNNHKRLIDRALMTAPNVLCIVGSYNAHRTHRNPFLASERQAMIRACYPKLRRLNYVYAFDADDDDEWGEQVEARIAHFVGDFADKPVLVANVGPSGCQLVHIFFDYPKSLSYEWENPTDAQIRERFFRGEDISPYVPRAVVEWLRGFTLTPRGDWAFDAHWGES